MKTHPSQARRLTVISLAFALLFQVVQAKEYLETLAVFTGTNGSHPLNLVETPDGDFYGVTQGGGAHDRGTLFKIPLHNPLVTLVHFEGPNGATPSSRLIQASRDIFYGTTSEGGAFAKGTVFQFNSTTGKLKTLVSFHGSDGARPEADLLATADGSLYGCTSEGGDNNLGTVFVITPNGQLKTLVVFKGENGSHPLSLILDEAGTVYGLTDGGGTYDHGTLFTMTSNGNLTTLHSFSGTQAVHPGARITKFNGDIYGTTSHGGQNNLGSIYRLTPDGVMTEIVSFDGVIGEHAGSDLIQWEDGYFHMERLYKNMKIKTPSIQWQGVCFCGTAKSGGAHGNGTIFLASPDGNIRTLASFSGTEGMQIGSNPNSLIPASDGNLYGTTSHGGPYNLGTIFRLQVQIWYPPQVPGAGFLPPIVSR